MAAGTIAFTDILQQAHGDLPVVSAPRSTFDRWRRERLRHRLLRRVEVAAALLKSNTINPSDYVLITMDAIERWVTACEGRAYHGIAEGKFFKWVDLNYLGSVFMFGIEWQAPASGSDYDYDAAYAQYGPYLNIGTIMRNHIDGTAYSAPEVTRGFTWDAALQEKLDRAKRWCSPRYRRKKVAEARLQARRREFPRLSERRSQRFATIRNLVIGLVVALVSAFVTWHLKK